MCAQPVSETPPPPPPEAPRRRGSQITPLQWAGLAVLVLLLANQYGLFRLGNPAAFILSLEDILPWFISLVIAITVHEFSHGLVATWFGDDTPRRIGRLTLNPLKHLDPLGTLMILVVHFGWGRPMIIDPSRMRNRNLGWALSSLGGPVSNVVVATLAATIIGLIGPQADPTLLDFLSTFIVLNVLLAVFNLVPLPPLDGFGFIFGLAPLPLKQALLPIRQFGPLILLAVLFLPPLRPFLSQFLAAGEHLLLPPLEVVCQCNLSV